MQYEIIKGSKIDINIINKYKNVLPEELIQLWEEYGYASLLDGYIKCINPDDYQELIENTYFRGKVSVPVFVTGFGDVITIEEGQYIGIVKYKNSDFSIVAKSIKRFLQNIEDEYYQGKYLELKKYEKAVNKYGYLNENECFGYVPLLGLGGSEKVENLQKVKIREHIEIITQLVGGV